jgi:signal transduction histidine kinase
VAHDLRSPLGAIGLKAAMLRRVSADERVKKPAEAIERVVRRMDHLVQGLLDAATLEAGQFSLRPSAFPVAGLVRDVIDLFADTAASGSVHLEHRSEESDLIVVADRDRTLQVLSNILVNAIKFTPALGRVEVSTQRDGAGAVRISVSDTGPGISSDKLPHVFERFWKASKDARTGTGLGPHIARELVTAQGGRIWAESRPGAGTTFHFTLAAAAAVSQPSELDAPAPSQALPAPASG